MLLHEAMALVTIVIKISSDHHLDYLIDDLEDTFPEIDWPTVLTHVAEQSSSTHEKSTIRAILEAFDGLSHPEIDGEYPQSIIPFIGPPLSLEDLVSRVFESKADALVENLSLRNPLFDRIQKDMNA